MVLKNSEKFLKKFLEFYEKKINYFFLLQFFYKVDSIYFELSEVKNYSSIWQFLVINILLTTAKSAK